MFNLSSKRPQGGVENDTPGVSCARGLYQALTSRSAIALGSFLLCLTIMERFVELYKVKSGIGGLTRLIRCFGDDPYTKEEDRGPHFLKEDPSHTFKTVKPTGIEDTFSKRMKVGIVMVKEEDIIDVLVVLEAAVILSNLRDVSSAISMLMGLLFALNIDYPKELKGIFEVIQNVLMNIGGRQCVSLVHGLRNRLLQ
ncbi:tripartite motif-containing protein 16 [Sarotherodon galilaeus]